jgi:thiol-disulfide isomerase/thioredoxin
VAAAVFAACDLAAAQSRGIVGRDAPSFGVSQWRNLPGEAKTLDVDDFRDKVLYLYCFQSWCPGCHSRGFPTLKKLIEVYDDADDVEFITVQTVFEGFSTNTPQAAWSTAERYELDIPVGHSGSRSQRSQLMRRYRTGGTPWTIIIDKQGVVRYDGFHVQVD